MATSFGLRQDAAARTPARDRRPVSDTTAAPHTPEDAPVGQRARRRQRSLIDRGHRYEYLDRPADPAGATASQSAAGPLGFAGTIAKPAAGAGGLTTLAVTDDTGLVHPMIPETWDGDPPQ